MNPLRPVPLSIALLAVVSVALAGCSPAPEPTPTPTPAFASEEEAFAAAEETYRAYIEALNAVDPSDPETFDATYDYSSGAFQRADRENFSTMHADGYSITGDSKVIEFIPAGAAAPFEVVRAIACLDVSEVVVTDADGASAVNPDRPAVYAIEVTFKSDDSQLSIDAARRAEDHECTRS
ncbi:hypothetical protein [Microbacterium sp. SA39]|uniref:hypothetical protein n=1 Tax=Microbacterium sp. SA39 TaxID=1263625 RepID=UPI0005F9FB55|nr:hypothetical protein [Microbacterium sp. SA39]KJQ54921.1 hypothetical protein RS85_01297 [Microbacterium sp. SA39]